MTNETKEMEKWSCGEHYDHEESKQTENLVKSIIFKPYKRGAYRISKFIFTDYMHFDKETTTAILIKFNFNDVSEELEVEKLISIIKDAIISEVPVAEQNYLCDAEEAVECGNFSIYLHGFFNNNTTDR